MGIAAIKGDRTIAEIAGQFDVHPNQVTAWKAQLEGGAADVFDHGDGSAPAAPAVDVKAPHAKIGELTLENDPRVKPEDRLFALKAGEWFRLGRLVIVSPDPRADLARRQAENPLIVLCRFVRPPL